MDRLLRSLLLIGAAQRLAVDGNRLNRGLGQNRRPGDEATLQSRRVEGGENVAQMIMGRSPIPEGAEPTQQRQFPFAEPRDVGERFAARQNRQKTQEQNFVEWIDHLSGLAVTLAEPCTPAPV